MSKKIITISLLTIAMLLTIYGILSFTTNDINLVSAAVANKKTVTSMTEATTGKLVEDEQDPDDYEYKIDIGERWVVDANLQHEKYVYEDGTEKIIAIPKYDEEESLQIYCIEPHVAVKFKYDITYEKALELEGKSYESKCKKTCASKPNNGDTTATVYTPLGEEQDLPVAAAYILTAPDLELDEDDPRTEDEKNTVIWHERQRAIWHLRDRTTTLGYPLDTLYNVYDVETASTTNIEDLEEDKSLETEAARVGLIKNYEDSISENLDEEGNVIPTIYDEDAYNYTEYDMAVRKEDGLNPENNTDKNKVKVKVNRKESEYTVGPFNLEYTNGVYGDIAFSGISSITVTGYNKYKKVVAKDIEIDRFLLKDEFGNYDEVSADDMTFFTPDEEYKVQEIDEDSIFIQSGQDFQIVFDNPNKGVTSSSKKVAYISINVKFKYMLANGKYQELEGIAYEVAYTCDHTVEPKHTHTYGHSSSDTRDPETNERICSASCRAGETYDCYGCRTTCYLKEHGKQNMMAADAIRSLYEQELELGIKIKDEPDEPDKPDKPDKPDEPDEPVLITMELGGNVWEDALDTKENKADGLNNGKKDIPLKNVKVTLYTSDGKIADLSANPEEKGISDEEIMNRINPTYTDEDGNYLFKGLDVMEKYYVEFEYNGQTYIPTEYTMDLETYNEEEWEISSKGTEYEDDRNEYNNGFAEIRSYPENYATSNSLGKVGKYNKTFTKYQLMGYTLNEEGKYSKTGIQLIDGYLLDENGNPTDKYNDGIISKKILEYISENKTSPDIEDIYEDIADENKNDTEIWNKLQFIEDCKITSYTKGLDEKLDLYPVYDKFVVDTERRVISVNQETGKTYKFKKTTYEPIYPGQRQINQGLWRRQESQLILQECVGFTAIRINGRTEIYQYDRFSDDIAEWTIEERLQNYAEYYGGSYVQGVYDSDYNYRGEQTNKGDNLEVYVTYQIKISNQSQGILNQITEVVSYYDSNYTYQKNLSWVMYDEINLKPADYQRMIADLSLEKIPNAKDIDSYEDSIYGSTTHSDIDTKNAMKTIYIRGLDDKKLATGDNAYIYLTFKLNSDNDGKILLTDYKNYAEINGYETFYTKGLDLPNNVEIENNTTVAGIIDSKSNPGNLYLEDITGEKYEKNFESDTDRARSISTVIKDEYRQLNGIVWEDERTSTIQNAVIGDGVRKDRENGIEGVIVQLVEKLDDRTEFLWRTTKTDKDGKYEFKGFIPGNYVVRFMYGYDKDTVLTTANGGKNKVSYNGQDYKSTVYQKNMTDGTEIAEYDAQYYDIGKADEYKANVSDAKDIWESKEIKISQVEYNNSNDQEFINVSGTSAKVQPNPTLQGRQEVNNYSTTLTNKVAEILATPYKSTINESDLNTLITKTNMVAETAIIKMEGEYNRTISIGDSKLSDGNIVYKNTSYSLNNLDFGLTERPKAQIELNKNVTNLKIKLANGDILFDSGKSVNNLIWHSKEDYDFNSNLKGNIYKYDYRDNIEKAIENDGLIQATMDEELMHGATVEITYRLSVKNDSETDYTGKEFYYKGEITSNSKVVTTAASQIIDYVSNNLQYREDTNKGWNIVKAENILSSGMVSKKLESSVKKFNTILQTTELSKELKPGEEISKDGLVLSKVITPENSTDNMTYDNIAEIVTINNTVGRRMAFSIVGNQDPTTEPAELDSSKAETVMILPPFGIKDISFILIGLVALMIAGGVILIKKKVLK